MTNKPMLSVERELLERVSSTKNMIDFLEAMDELRALRDEPETPMEIGGYAPSETSGAQMEMSDEWAQEVFSKRMLVKLEASAAKGRNGWQQCSQESLSRMLREHVDKGDPVDVANFCMFLDALGYGIAPAAQHQDSNPGWPDPLESTLAKEIINNPAAFDLAIRDLFDKLCREIQAGRYYRRFSGSEPMEFTANQGEPVAYLHRNTRHTIPALRNKWEPITVASAIAHMQNKALAEEGKEDEWHLGHEFQKCYAEQPAPVAVVMPELESEFEAWWESDGQYCRAGGGSYEKTFAYRAYEAALAEVARLNGVKP